ncbi:MAG: hypothetical protein ABF449_00570 [Ethanoligenens sp.]
MNNKILEIPVGSGYLYITQFTGNIPTDAVIETQANLLGYIEKGATVQYKPTTKTFKDDYGIVQRTVVTDEAVTMKASLIAWSSVDLDKFSLTGRVTETNGKRTVKIGGLQNATNTKYLWRFVHPDNELGDVRLTIVGTNTGGFTLTYKQDDSGNLDLEVTAQPSDVDGTLVLYEEEVLGDTQVASGLTIASAPGTTSGTTVLTVTPVKATGDGYVYDFGARSPAVGENLSTWTTWDGTSAITAQTGDLITLAEVDGNGTAVKAGRVVIAALA